MAKLRAASAFLGEVRETQRLTGKSLSGRVDIEPRTRLALERMCHDSRMLGMAESVTDGAVRPLLERFEEMCRRRKMEPSSHLRPSLYKIIAVELLANEEAYGVPGVKLIPATLTNGDLSGLPDELEFEQICNVPSLFQRAVLNVPTDPRAFLRHVLAATNELAVDPEFAGFTDTPWVFRRAATHAGDPRAFLRRVISTIAELEADPELAQFHQTSGIFRYAAIRQPGQAKTLLLQALNVLASLQSEEEFKPLEKMPAVVAHAVITHPADPRGALRRILAGSGPIKDPAASNDLGFD